MNEAAIRKVFPMKWLRRFLWMTLGLFFLFSIAVIALSYVVLDSERGTQWSLQMAQRLLPGLTIDETHGSWQRGIHIGHIIWRDESTDVEIDDVQLQLRWPLLLRGEINLSMVHAQTLRLTSKGKGSDKPLALPTLFLPLALSTSDLALVQLDIVNGDSTFSLNDLRSALYWRATTLQLSNTQLRWQQMKLSATGTLGFRGDYPLKLQGQLSLPQWPGSISLQTQGDLRKLELQVQSLAPYSLKANVLLATLDKNLPLQIHAELSQPFAYTFGKDRIEILKGNVDARGDLTGIDAMLALALNDSRYGTSKIDGNWVWQPDRLQTQLQWQPASGNLQLQCDAQLQQPVTATCHGKANSIALTPWLAGQTGSISSAIKIEAKWLEPQWSLALAMPDISGQFNSDTLAGNLAAQTADGALWQLQSASLRVGPNELNASGQFGHRNRLQFDINARDLSHLHPRLSGALMGNAMVDGDIGAPTVRARLNGSRLQFDNLRITQARLELLLPKLGNESGRARVDLLSASIGSATPLDLTLALNGDRNSQHWALTAQQQASYARLQCITQSDTSFDNWQLNCPDFSGRVRTSNVVNQDWRNAAALRGHAQLANKQFELSPFCLRGGDIELCLEQALRYADNKIAPSSARAHGIPLAWTKPWLPDDFHLINDARVSAQAQLKSFAPLEALASVQIPQTRWRWHTATATETAEINAIHFDASLDEKRALLSASAQSPTIGRIDARLAIDDPRQQRALDGRVDIAQFQLSGLAWAFQGLDAISGEINGSIGIAGTAAAPLLRGQLLLKDGSATWAPLGAPFRTVHADLTFDNNSAKLGGWFALGQGGGDIDGKIDWDGAGENWKLHVGVVAGGVSAMPLPNSTVVFSPHAQLNAAPGEMHIDGYIDIAKAEIQLKELPPQTTDVSQDQEIVGQRAEPDAWKLWAELGLNLGDEFHLMGFGADVNLSGRLQLGKAPGDVLHMTGEVKVPRGRYRAYGQRLTIRKGSVIFYGPLDNPDLNLEAVRDMPLGVTDVVGMRVIGSLKTPEAILFSEPSMPDSDIAYYLLTGRKPVAGTTGTSGYSASGALLSLGLAGSEGKAGQLAQRFGITDLQLGTSENATGESEAEVSGQLGKDLYVRYGRGLGQQSNSISFQYRLTPKLMIETISGIEDALDLLYSFEIK